MCIVLLVRIDVVLHVTKRIFTYWWISVKACERTRQRWRSKPELARLRLRDLVDVHGHLEDQAGVGVAQLLRGVGAVEAVPADKIDAQRENPADQAVHVGGREGALVDAAPDGVAEDFVGQMADLDDLVVVLGE
jgi:hypothetical protein